MNRFILAVSIVVFTGFSAHIGAQDKDTPETDEPVARDASAELYENQSDLMECIPPTFLLISEIDLEEGKIVGMSSMQHKTAIAGFHLMFKLDEVKLANARRVPLKDEEVKNLKGKVVVMTKGKKPLGAAYLRLFREDTVVLTVLPSKNKE